MCHRSFAVYCACTILILAIGPVRAHASGGRPSSSSEATASSAAAGPDNGATEGTQGSVTADNAPAGGVLLPVVITAERIRTTVQKTPALIQVVSGATLADTGTTDITALQLLNPDLHILSIGNRLSGYMRGVGTVVSDQNGSSSLSYSIDGVPLVRTLPVNGSFFDLDRIEVLVGPQGTLYGRNSMVGAINIIRNKPVLNHYSGSATLTGGNYNLFRSSGVVNIPMGATFALRAAFATEKHAGYLTSGQDDADSDAARLSALWRPNDTFSVLVRTQYYRDTGLGVGDVPLKSPTGSFLDPSDPWHVATGVWNNNTVVGTNENQRLSVGIISADIKFDLGPETLTIIPGYVDTKYRALAYQGGFEQYYNTPDRQESLEARVTSNGSTRLQWVAGLIYIYDHQSGQNDLGVTTTAFSQTTYSKLNLDTYAAYGQATYRITPKFRILAGIRYTHDLKTMRGAISTVSIPDFRLIAPGPRIYGDLKYNNVSYKAGLQYDLASDHLVYANVATGFGPGGFNSGTPPNTYKPEHIWAYTIGSKNRFLQRRVLVNAEAWYWDITNMDEYQFGMLNPFPNITLVTYNAARLVSKGVEAQMEFAVGDNGVLSLSPAYTDAGFQKFNLPAFDFGPFRIPASNLAGTPNQFAPQWSANLSYRQRVPLSNGAALIGRISSQLKSSEIITVTPVLGYRVPSTTVTNLSLTYRAADHRWSVDAWVKNVGNTPLLVWGGNTPAGFWGHLAPPRTFGVTVRASFGR